MITTQQKLRLLEKIQESKGVLFGKFTSTITKDKKRVAWTENLNLQR